MARLEDLESRHRECLKKEPEDERDLDTIGFVGGTMTPTDYD